MKKIISTFLLCFSCFVVYAQKINETDKILLFIKTCNFLKYNHPQFTSGKIGADSFFLAKYKLLQNISTKPEVNSILLKSIHELGELKLNLTLKQASTKEILKINSLHKWYIEGKYVNDSLKKVLLQVYNSRDVKSHHYAPALNYDTEIPNEKKYNFEANINLPEDVRLLALAKLQGVIAYLYPHQKLMKENWDVVIRRNIPLFKNCTSRKDYEVLILKIVANLNDSHAYNRFYSSLKFRNQIFKNSFYPPFDYKIVNKRILVTGIIVPEICKEAGISVGDWITNINEHSIKARIDTLSQLLSSSNRNTLIANLANYSTNLLWSADHPILKLRLLSNKEKKTVDVNFIKINDKISVGKINTFFQNKVKIADTLRGFMVLKNDIAYFNIDKIIELLNNVADDKLDSHLDSILDLAAKQKAIIFDMRGYPQWSGFIYTYLYQKFGTNDLRFAKYFKADLNNIGTFDWINSAAVYNNEHIVPEQFKYEGKVTIIVNAVTRSLSEWNVMNLQSMFPNAKTIGEQTSGGDGDEKHINIPGNYTIYFTGNAIYYPNGSLAQGKGVRIDRIVKPKAADILSGKDTQLDYAIKSVR